MTPWSRALPGVLLAMALVGCGDDPSVSPGAASDPSPSVATSSARPTSAATSAPNLGEVLRDASIAEEAYFTDSGTYTTDLGTLQEQGLEIPAGVTVRVIHASATRYCISVSGSAGTFYVDSETGQPGTTPCS